MSETRLVPVEPIASLVTPQFDQRAVDRQEGLGGAEQGGADGGDHAAGGEDERRLAALELGAELLQRAAAGGGEGGPGIGAGAGVAGLDPARQGRLEHRLEGLRGQLAAIDPVRAVEAEAGVGVVGEDLVGVVLVPAGVDLDLAVDGEGGGGFALAPHRAAEQAGGGDPAPGQGRGQDLGLTHAGGREHVVVLGAEGGLSVANEEDAGHGFDYRQSPRGRRSPASAESRLAA